VKDETPHTRYVAVDPENVDDRAAAQTLTRQLQNFEEIDDKNEKIAIKIARKQYTTNSAKKKKPKEFREWKRDYIRDTDGDQMALLMKSLVKMRNDPRKKAPTNQPATATSNQKVVQPSRYGQNAVPPSATKQEFSSI